MSDEWWKIRNLDFQETKDGYHFLIITDESYDAVDGYHEGAEEHKIFFRSDCTWSNVEAGLNRINYHFQTTVEKQIRSMTRKVFEIVGPNHTEEKEKKFWNWWCGLRFEQYVANLSSKLNYEDALAILNRVYVVDPTMKS